MLRPLQPQPSNIMERGSKFTAALMAIIALQFLHPSNPQIPLWQDLSAALTGSFLAWAMQVCADRLRAWRKLPRRQGPA